MSHDRDRRRMLLAGVGAVGALAMARSARAASCGDPGPLAPTRPTAAGLATLFSCTNTSSDPVRVSVELFVDAGGNPCNTADAVDVDLSSGESVMFSTQNNIQSSFFSTQPLTAVDMFLSLGSARIVATGKGLICTAMVADMYSSPPQSMTQIVLAPKGKQK